MRTFQDFQNETFQSVSEYLIPFGVIGTTFGFGMGMGGVPVALLGEILPLKIKSIATSTILFLKFIVIFTVVKNFPFLVNAIGLHSTFWIHAGISVLMCVLSLLILPDTQGKTLTEISQLYTKQKIHA